VLLLLLLMPPNHFLWLQSGQKVVTRPPQYDDDSQLPSYFFQETGAFLCTYSAASRVQHGTQVLHFG
jgi:hypothetical protein